MNKKSLKNNFLYNLLNNLVNVMFPLITFPYLARILHPEGIGKYNFGIAIIQYFILLASLGIPLYGSREVAKLKLNRKRLNSFVSSILQINFLAMILSYLIFLILSLLLKFTRNDSLFYFLLSLNIIFSIFNLDWLYQGLEEYKIISLRNICIKSISLLLILVFVKHEDDFLIYTIINVSSSLLLAVFNYIFSRKYVIFTFFKVYNLRKIIKPIFIVFSMNLAISIYCNLDSVMLGVLSDNKSVGYYTSAIKIIKLILTLITSLSAVMLPRFSFFLENNMKNEFHNVSRHILHVLYIIIIPSMIGVFVLSYDIILLFSGELFLPAVGTMKIMVPLIFILSLSNYLGIQILYPQNQEKIVLFSVIAGAISNFSLNMFFIPLFYWNGAAIATVIAECIVLLIQLIAGKKYINLKFFDIYIIKYVFAGLVMGFTVFFINKFFEVLLLRMLISVFIGFITYLIMLILLQDEIVLKEINKFFKRLKNV